MVKIKLNKKIYPLSALKKAIEAYKDLASFSLKDQAGYRVIEIKKSICEDKQLIIDEFANYVLAMAKDGR